MTLLDRTQLAALAKEAGKALSERQVDLYRPYPKQAAFHAAGAQFRERLLIAGNQLGKELRFDEPVLTPTGWVEIQHLRVGDEVIAGDGSVTTVTGHFPQGVKPLIELELCYGTRIVAGAEHLWLTLPPASRFRTRCVSLPAPPGQKRGSKMAPNERFGRWEVLTTEQMRAAYGDTPAPKYRFALPATGAAALQPRPVPFDPYVLGLLLGDGGLTREVLFSSRDAELADALARAVVPLGAELVPAGRDFRVRGSTALRDILRDLGAMGCGAHEKRVPDLYLWNSPEVRLAVLQGLMDTDGTCEKSGNTSFTSVSQQLAQDAAFLARSFGAKCEIKSRLPSFTYRGVRRLGRRAFTVTIRLPHVPLFRLGRKLARVVRPVSTSDHHIVVGYRDVAPAEAFCISVDHPSRTYVTRDFVVTHNTWSGGAEMSYHLTGEYPDWWKGRRFRKPVAAWAAGVTGEATRDTVQRVLMGRKESHGTGMIPKRAILETSAARGVADTLDQVVVQHKSGGKSVLAFKSYEKGREKWQGETLDVVWFDEEPPEDIYNEGLTRTNATGGMAFMTFTPLQGMSNVVRLFYPRPTTGDRHVTQMTIDDAEHLDQAQRDKIVAAYAPHEREARAKGIPMLGSGRIFPIPETAITVAAFAIPAHWPRIGGMDLGGYDHPTAAARLAWDRDADVVYVTDTHRASGQTIMQNAATIKAWGHSLPIAWPHDALSHDRGSGETFAELYRQQGLNMLWERATFEDGGSGLEAGLAMMLDRLETGRLKIFDHLGDWFEEYRLYHRREGKVVKETDDLMSATRYALMMLRFAAVPRGKNSGPLKRNIKGIR